MKHVFSSWYRVLLWLIFLVAVVVRLDGLFVKAEVDWAQADVGRDVLIGRHIATGWDGWLATPYSSWAILPSSPLHYWMVASWYAITHSVYGVYLLNAGFSLLAVGLMVLIGREIAGKSAGLFLGFVAAVSPLLLGYASLVSQISLLPVFGSLVVFALLRYARRLQPLWLWLMGVSLIPMVLLHNSGVLFAVVVLIVTIVSMVLAQKWHRNWLSLATIGLLVWLCFYGGVIRLNAVNLTHLVSQFLSELQTVSIDSRGTGFTQIISGIQVGLPPGFVVVFCAVSVSLLCLSWKSINMRCLVYTVLTLAWSVVLVGMAPLQSLGGLREHYVGPWLPILLVFGWGWPWLLPESWLARLAKLGMVGVFLWWSLSTRAFPIFLPDLRFYSAPQSLVQVLWADAQQSGFAEEGFEIWSVIWERDAWLITDWYSGGWWDGVEQLAGRQLVSVLPVQQKQNNIHVNVIGGGVYLICPDDPISTQHASQELQTQFQVSERVIGQQWLSRQTAECLDVFWRDGDDALAKDKTWMLGRFVAPGSKTGGYALFKYHN